MDYAAIGKILVGLNVNASSVVKMIARNIRRCPENLTEHAFPRSPQNLLSDTPRPDRCWEIRFALVIAKIVAF
jgi:hypothetical protein